jgi:hypothetical protein
MPDQVACGAPLLAVEWGRDGGWRRQSDLFASRDGPPTRTLLRFAGSTDQEAVAQRHELVTRATGVDLPTRAEQEADPRKADAAYDAAVTALRELTRDKKQFPLVVRENAGYGFRRNLWGRKSYGIAVALVVLVVAGGLIVAAAVGHETLSWKGATIAAAFAAAALVVWLTTITSD